MASKAALAKGREDSKRREAAAKAAKSHANSIDRLRIMPLPTEICGEILVLSAFSASSCKLRDGGGTMAARLRIIFFKQETAFGEEAVDGPAEGVAGLPEFIDLPAARVFPDAKLAAFDEQ